MPSIPSQTVGVIHIDGGDDALRSIGNSRSRFSSDCGDVRGVDFPATIYINANRLSRELNESYRVIARRLKLQ